MIDFLRANPFVVPVVAIAVAVALWLLAQRRELRRVRVGVITSKVVDIKPVGQPEALVVLLGGKPVGNLFSHEITILNDGRKDLSGSDMFGPAEISNPTEILQCNLQEGPANARLSASDERTMHLKIDLLKAREDIRVSVLSTSIDRPTADIRAKDFVVRSVDEDRRQRIMTALLFNFAPLVLATAGLILGLTITSWNPPRFPGPDSSAVESRDADIARLMSNVRSIGTFLANRALSQPGNTIEAFSSAGELPAWARSRISIEEWGGFSSSAEYLHQLRDVGIVVETDKAVIGKAIHDLPDDVVFLRIKSTRPTFPYKTLTVGGRLAK